jgi:AcrR family transcriptional regulator
MDTTEFRDMTAQKPPARRTAAPSRQRPAARRRASQARSKTTVQRILDSAAALIVEEGAERVTMTKIAQRANVVIGSLYQYFSDKSAIHKALLIQHNADARLLLHTSVSHAKGLEEFIQSLERAFEQYFSLHQKDALVNCIWSVVQTDAELQRLDIEDTLQNARYLQSICKPMFPHVNGDRLIAACALTLQLALSTGRFARAIPPAIGQQTLPIFRRMIRDVFQALKVENDE